MRGIHDNYDKYEIPKTTLDRVINNPLIPDSAKKKGKCYSKVNRGQRNERDFYQTPYSMTKQLLESELFCFDGTYLEPACGENAIVDVLLKSGVTRVNFYDKKNGNYDFLDEDRKFNYVITNPPYSQALEFVQKAKEVALNKFAMLLKLDFLSGKKRYHELYSGVSCYPLSKVLIFTRMPMLTDKIREDGKYKTGMQTYAWFVWEKKTAEVFQQPKISWLNCDPYVVGKGD